MIDSFRGAYRCFSNFFPCSVDLDGFQYPSVEHAYQAAKTCDPVERMIIRMMPRAGQTKSYGRQIKHLYPDWDLVKIEIMRGLLRQKFADLALKWILLNTGSEELVEGNYWGDTFWGVCNGTGENWLGRLLMEVREELR